MGSFTSRPKAPSVEYVPVYTPSIPTSTAPTASGPSAEETRNAQRAASLLERERGRLGTITTGFRGLLGQSSTPQRKTLLGE